MTKDELKAFFVLLHVGDSEVLDVVAAGTFEKIVSLVKRRCAAEVATSAVEEDRNCFMRERDNLLEWLERVKGSLWSGSIGSRLRYDGLNMDGYGYDLLLLPEYTFEREEDAVWGFFAEF